MRIPVSVWEATLIFQKNIFLYIMWKPRFINILLYFLVKYMVYFIIIAFMDDRFKSIVIDNSENNREFFLILFIIYFIFLLFRFSLLRFFLCPYI